MTKFTEIKGYEKKYGVSKCGCVFSYITNRQLKSYSDRGYPAVKLNKKTHKIHRLVAVTYIPNPQNKPCVNHINGIKVDNNINNLEWCTYSENHKHAYSNGLMDKKGMKNHNSILCDADILEIRMLLVSGVRSIDISRIYNVKPNTISQIKTKDRWGHIE